MKLGPTLARELAFASEHADEALKAITDAWPGVRGVKRIEDVQSKLFVICTLLKEAREDLGEVIE